MLRTFNQAVAREQRLSKSQQSWFPRLLRQFSTFSQQDPNSPLDCSRNTVESFLRHLKQSGKAPWQRLQALEAIQCYARLLLPSIDPGLTEMHRLLSAAKKRESDARAAPNSNPAPEIDPQLLYAQPGNVGRLDPNEPNLDREMRKLMRVRHYARRTENAYLGWLRRFRLFLNRTHLRPYHATPPTRVRLQQSAARLPCNRA